MDVSQYIGTFVSEAQEHLDSLNDCLLILEKDSSDSENINKIFRAFHTLKGNSAAMGFMKFSDLAHALEDILSKIRDKEIKTDRNIIDIILEGCDILENGLEEVSNGNPDNIDSEHIMNEIKKYLTKDEEIISVKIDDVVQLSEEEKHVVNRLKKEGDGIIRIVAIFEKNNPIRSLKSLLIIREISKIGTIIKTTPDQKAITTGKFDTEAEFILGTKENKEAIEKVVSKITGIKYFFVMGINDKYKKPEEALHVEKELAKAAIANQHKESVIKQIQGVKVEMGHLDKLMNLVGELLINNIRLKDIEEKQDFIALKKVVEGVDRLTLDLQDEVMLIRMVPIGNIFRRFPRMVRDLAEKEGKEIDIVIEGQEITFDRTVLDQIGDPLVHILRNCVDHGIESHEERKKAGKPNKGLIKLVARREKNSAVIEVSDDGRGIDPYKVKMSCIKRGVLSVEEADRMNENELQMMVFRPNVSTNEVITDVSGRGVGMDVVMSMVKELGGVVKMQSTIGKGTVISMNLPLTLAIITALLVKVNEEVYALPLTSIDRTVDVDSSKIKSIQGNSVFILRNREIPLLWMHELTGSKCLNKKERLTVVIVNTENNLVGLVVDSIVSQQQVLIKSLDEIIKGTKGISGATILGDGSVAMIIDVASLL